MDTNRQQIPHKIETLFALSNSDTSELSTALTCDTNPVQYLPGIISVRAACRKKREKKGILCDKEELVKAEFGFAFPFVDVLSAPEIDLPEPLAKRRKVVSNDTIVESATVKNRDVSLPADISAPVAPQPVEGGIAIESQTVKRTRKRKLLDLDDAAGSAPPPLQDDIDDSFVTGLKTVSRSTCARTAIVHGSGTEHVKVSAAKKSKATPREMTLRQDVIAPLARCGSRRQAAVMAVEKVAMSLVEETIPVDMLRRGVAPERPTHRTGKRKASTAGMLASPAVIPLLDPRITYTAKLTASLAAAEKLSSRTEPRRKQPTARRPLRETDANIARASLSPAKGDKVLQTVGLSTSNKERNESWTKSEAIRPSGESLSEQLHPQLATTRHASRRTAGAHRAAIPLGSTANITKTDLVQGSNPLNSFEVASKVSTKTKRRVATEDDLDLLFATQSTRVKSNSRPGTLQIRQT
nr:hypothetical protein B0A51_17581 [Rachicladosporium sp. CCFEE 5018]